MGGVARIMIAVGTRLINKKSLETCTVTHALRKEDGRIGVRFDSDPDVTWWVLPERHEVVNDPQAD